MKESENLKLVQEFGQKFTDACYDYLQDYKKEKGYKTKDDNLTIRRWVVKAVREKNLVPLNGHNPTEDDKW